MTATENGHAGTPPAWDCTADLLVIGTGIAGLTAATRARELGLRVLVITKDAVDSASTAWAQGGVAVADDGESPAGSVGEANAPSAITEAAERTTRDGLGWHCADTVAAGAGLCDEAAARTILAGGPEALARLRSSGVRFDAGPDGRLARTREGGHGAFRVVHAGGDATGAEIERALVATASEWSVPVLEGHCAVELVRGERGGVAGALVLDREGKPGLLRSAAVLLATGGLGQLYRHTTNPSVATADGLALALRAGARVCDLEFVQFHPTALHVPGADGGSRPLVTEALRGEGAVLVDAAGERVTAGVHALGDLAPRDVVAAAIGERTAGSGQDHVYLDATGIVGFPARFPTVHASCRAAGIDPGRDPIPVAPAAHYSCGGIASTVDGRTSVPGLYAAGEVARAGLHGANRLASNSLLEGAVVANRVARAIAQDQRCGLLDERPVAESVVPAVPVPERAAVRRAMTAHAGIRRDAAGLTAASAAIDRSSVVRPLRTTELAEDAALALVGRALLLAAGERTESRGCHRRSDHPERDDSRWRRSTSVRLDVAGHFMISDADATAAELGGCRVTGPNPSAAADPAADGGSVNHAMRAGLSESLAAQVRETGLDPAEVVEVVERALREDLRYGPDATTAATVPANAVAEASITARQSGVLAGVPLALAVFEAVLGEDGFEVLAAADDGASLAAGQAALRLRGRVRGLLTAERTALNLLCHLSGIATATAAWESEVDGTGCRIRDSRKTLPGLRLVQKYAVRCGGGVNHRRGLGDAVLIKDNHVAAAGSVSAALRACLEHAPQLPREVEVDSLAELDEVLAAGAELVLLDNFDVPACAEAVRRTHVTSPGTELEVSGGLALSLAGRYAATGVDYLAVGGLTHSVSALDLGLDM